MDLHIAVISHTGRTNSAVGRSHGPDPLVDQGSTVLRAISTSSDVLTSGLDRGNVVTWVRKLIVSASNHLREERSEHADTFGNFVLLR